MKRDLDYIREFLLKCEASEDFRFSHLEHVYIEGKLRDLLPEGWDFKTLYHYELLKDAGLLVEYEKSFPPNREDFGSTECVWKFRLSNSGHDYLDSIRDTGIWAETKSVVAEQGGNVALEVIKSLAIGFVKKKLEDQTGMKL